MPKMKPDLTVTLIPQDITLHVYEFVPWENRLEYKTVLFFEAGEFYIHDEGELTPGHYAIRKKNVGKMDDYGLLYLPEKNDDLAARILKESPLYCGGEVSVVDAELIMRAREAIDSEEEACMERVREHMLIWEGVGC